MAWVGLYLVKETVEQLGGTIDVKSEVRKLTSIINDEKFNNRIHLACVFPPTEFLTTFKSIFLHALVRFLTLPCFLLIGPFCLGQSEISNDSINQLVDGAISVTQKIEILNNAAMQLRNTHLTQSFDYASQAYALATKADDKKGTILALLTIGRYYTKIGRHETAMEKYLKALEQSQKIGDDRLISQTYKVIGNGFYFRNEIPASLQYYQKALQLNLKLNDKESTADLQNNIALVFLDQNKLDSAEIFLQEAALAYENLQLPEKLANAWLNWGEVKAKQQKHNQAMTLYQKALAINQSRGIKLQEGFVLARMASSLIALNRLADAKSYSKRALIIALEEDFQPLLVQAYETLYQLSKQLQDFGEAIQYHEQLLAVKESLFNQEKSRQIEELRTKYESEQKELENLELVKEASLKESQLGTTRMLLGLSSAFTIIVGVLAYFFYRSLQETRKARVGLQLLNKEIQEKNEEITAQSEELIEANHEITSINENLENIVEEKTYRILQQNEKLKEYAYKNAHKVRGPLARILGLLNLVKSKAIQESEIPFLLSEIEKASSEMDTVIKEINSNLKDSD